MIIPPEDAGQPNDERGAPGHESARALHALSDRRAFLRHASALTLAIPGLGAALMACSSEEHPREGGGEFRVEPPKASGYDSSRLHSLGVQTFAVAAGGGMVFDLMADVPGELPL